MTDPAERRARLAADVERTLDAIDAEGARVPSDDVDALQRRASLVDLLDRLRPRPARKRRWPAALAFVVTLAIVSVLTTVRLPRADVELDAEVGEFSFRLPIDQSLTDGVALRAFGIAGATRVDAERASDDPTGALQLRVGRAGCEGSITLDGIVFPKGSRVLLHAVGSPARVQWVTTAPDAQVHLTLDGCVEVNGRARNDGVRDLTLRFGRDDVDLAMEAATPPLAFKPIIRAGDLSLARVEKVARGDDTLVRPLSTLLSGTLVFPSLDTSRKLRFAEAVRFTGDDGELRSIEVGDGRLRIRYHAAVGDVTTGAADEPRSLMPTWLEWLQTNHSVSLLWGSALGLFGWFLALSRWWKTD